MTAAVARAVEAAGDKLVHIMGGASIIRQADLVHRSQARTADTGQQRRLAAKRRRRGTVRLGSTFAAKSDPSRRTRYTALCAPRPNSSRTCIPGRSTGTAAALGGEFQPATGVPLRRPVPRGVGKSHAVAPAQRKRSSVSSISSSSRPSSRPYAARCQWFRTIEVTGSALRGWPRSVSPPRRWWRSVR